MAADMIERAFGKNLTLDSAGLLALASHTTQ